MKNLKLIINKIRAKLWIKIHLNFDRYKYFFCPSGIGDTLYVLSYIKEYKKINPDVKVFFIIKKSHFSLIEMYNDYIDEVLILELGIFKCLSMYLENKRDELNIIYAHPLKLIFDPCKILGIRGLNLLDLYKVILDLPFDSKFCLPTISKIYNKNLEKLAKEDKKVLLCPYCVSTTMISFRIWENIANYFKNKGYKVYTNVKDQNEKPIKDTISLCLELRELYDVADTFSHIFSIRSGLCDLISFTNVNLTVFYQSDNNGDSSKEYDVYNFKNIGVRQDINEVIVNDKFDVNKYLKNLNHLKK